MADPKKSYNDIITWAKGTSNDIIAKQLATARTISITNNGGTSLASGTFNGTGNLTLKLPATVPISISGNAATATSATSATSATTAGTCTGNAATATKLKTARTISLTGDVTGSGSFDGGGNLSLSTALSSFTRITTTDNYYSYPFSGGSPITSGTVPWDVSYNNFIGIAVLGGLGWIYEVTFNITPATSRAIFMKVPSVMKENFNKFILLPSVSNIYNDNTESYPFQADSESTSRRGPCGFILTEFEPGTAQSVVRDTDWWARMFLSTDRANNSAYLNLPQCLSIRINFDKIPTKLYSSTTSFAFGFYRPAVVGFKI